MTETPIEQHQVFSRLIDFLDETKGKINWDKYCWANGRNYVGDELLGKRDNEFASTHYHAGLIRGELHFDYHID